MSRPSTEGCTEWSCMYHGGENRFKSGHAEDCPIRSFKGFVISVLDGCTCGERGACRACQVPRCTCSHTSSS